MYNAFWSTAGGFHAIAQLHNNLVSESLAVTPVIYSQTGERIALDPVNLVPRGNAQLDIGAELAKKGRSTPASGSAAFEYQARFAGALSAEVYVADESKIRVIHRAECRNPNCFGITTRCVLDIVYAPRCTSPCRTRRTRKFT